jgi:hypothetical protein
VTELGALDPGQVLVPASFDPGSQAYEPAAPERGGIFTGLEPAAEGNGGRLKTLWRHGYRTLRWKVEDPNGDELVAALEFRPEGGSTWLPMADELEEDHYSFDATVLPDGLYRFRLQVSDERSNRGGGALVAERTSEPVVVDHGLPRLAEVRRAGDAIEVEVEDAWNPLRRAEVSLDGGEWHTVPTLDGLLDGRRETLRVAASPDAGFVLLRVMDAAFNTASFELGAVEP